MNKFQDTNDVRRPEVGKKKKHRVHKVLLIILSCMLLIALLLWCGWHFIDKLYTPHQNTLPPRNEDESPSNENEEQTTEDDGYRTVVANDPNSDKTRREGIYTFLIVGRDHVALNTDVIMIASFDVTNSRVTVIQIPRDTYVERWGYPHKINSIFGIAYSDAYRTGSDDQTRDGMLELASTISENIGLPIDFYVMVNLEGFRNIIDVLGGVDIYVPFHMVYEDPEQDLYIDLPEGQTHLDGEKAEQFVRFRKGYYRADLGRLNAQRVFLSALAEQLKESLTGLTAVSTASRMAEQAFRYVSTDLTALDFVYFAKAFLKVDISDVRMTQLPGEAIYSYGVSYFGINRNDTVAMLGEYFNCFTEPFTDEDFDPKYAFVNNNDQDFMKTYSKETIGAEFDSADDIAAGGLDEPHF